MGMPLGLSLRILEIGHQQHRRRRRRFGQMANQIDPSDAGAEVAVQFAVHQQHHVAGQRRVERIVIIDQLDVGLRQRPLHHRLQHDRVRAAVANQHDIRHRSSPG